MNAREAFISLASDFELCIYYLCAWDVKLWRRGKGFAGTRGELAIGVYFLRVQHSMGFCRSMQDLEAGPYF